MEQNSKSDFKSLSWDVSEETYRADSALSYSMLSKFNREGFNNLSTLKDKVDSPSLLFGSMVDTLITDGTEAFEKKYMAAEYKSPSDAQMKIAKDLYDNFNETYSSIEDIPDSVILGRAEAYKYQANWRNETRVKVLKESCSEYYNLRKAAGDRILVESSMVNDAMSCRQALYENPQTSRMFVEDPFDTDIQRYFQLKFRGSFKSVITENTVIPLRCMADLIIVDHSSKKIIPVDLKTSSKKEWDFHKSFYEWGYWIQAQLYWYIIHEAMLKDPVFSSYVLQDYRFVVVNRESLTPLVWTYGDTEKTTDAIYGRRGNLVCRNWRGIASELWYYLTHEDRKVPLGIESEYTNNITEWMNKY